ncbi:sensor histidine kinase [Cupriavidus agavae]|uniref:sensor histidine kinase n=1 Tax=Cupriavidus agavae TaxID=1001822 RepID=UPI001F25ABE0|nr:HAMP domain-containing sensor histidine kinase [Cupriavidus agavae]
MSLLINRAAVRSLHGRLSLSLGALALLVGLLGALGAGLVVQQMGRQFNQDLQAAAASIHPAPAQMPLRADASHPMPHVVIQTWRPGDGALPGHTSDATVLLPRAREGFSSVQGANGNLWDVFALQAGDAYVQIAEQRAVRNDNAWRVAMWTAVPVLLLLPVLIWLIRASVRLSLRPLGAMGARVAQADLNHLEPVDIRTAPEELHLFLASINHMMARLVTLIQTERTFIANAAHELRSPITALQLQVDNLRNAPADAQDERLDALQRGIRRTATLVTQLLGLARAEIGAESPPVAVALPQLVTDVVADLLPLALDRGVDLGVEQLDDATVQAQETDLRMLV